MATKPPLSKELLEELLDLDPETGVLTWKRRRVGLFPAERDQQAWNTNYAGKVAGCVYRVNGGSLGQITLFGKRRVTARVVWVMLYGYWPDKQIRHRDGDATNHRKDNLVEFGDNVEKRQKDTAYRDTPPQGLLLSLLSYDNDTGELRWKTKAGDVKWNNKLAGNVAGSINAYGYLLVRVEKQCFGAHRLIFKMMTGREPANQIDHINGVRHDNRWCNLREATSSQNNCNSSLLTRNALGCKGVYEDKRQPVLPFYGEIRLRGKRYRTPSFATAEEASEAVKALRTKIHKEFANHG
jgi:hypothetical protein